MRNIAATYQAEKNNPVAVVYYRCEQQGTKYTAYGHLYYVHNGVALDNLPDKNNRVRISHVATWPHTNEVYIFGENEAAQALKDGKGKTDCCGSEEVKDHIINDPIWRPWIWVAFLPYSVNHQPIAWMVDNDPKDPHNGVLHHLECPKKEECTLHYWHFKNNNIQRQDKGENPRTAYAPKGTEWDEKFLKPGPQLESETVKAGQPKKGSLTIATQPPPVTRLSPCP